jgi:tetratricopeptide (TPR) repeat protein
MEMSGFLESLAGAHEVAERNLRRSLNVLRSARHAPDTQNTQVAIARELFEQGQLGAAELALDQVESNGGLMSARARIAAGALRARLASARGRDDEAVAAASRARELSADIDDLYLIAETLCDLAVVLAQAGKTEEATTEGLNALRAFEAKGATLSAGRVREWLSGVAGASTGPGVPDR